MPLSHILNAQNGDVCTGRQLNRYCKRFVQVSRAFRFGVDCKNRTDDRRTGCNAIRYRPDTSVRILH